MDRLSRPYYFKGCPPQILLSPLLSTYLLFILTICKLLQWSYKTQLSNITHNLSLTIFGNLHTKQTEAATGGIL